VIFQAVLTRAGRRMYEGAAPDRSSRLVVIGELGVAIQLNRELGETAGAREAVGIYLRHG
jgi:hypothetical protein